MKKTERLLEKADNYYQELNFEQALRLYNQVLNREPANRKALRKKGLITIQREDRGKAITFLESSVEICRDSELNHLLGTLYLKEKETGKAKDFLHLAIKLNPDNAEAHYHLGLVFAHHENDHQKAVDCFSRVIKNNSANANAFFYRGCSYMILQQAEKAEKDLLKAKELGHEHAPDMLEEMLNK